MNTCVVVAVLLVGPVFVCDVVLYGVLVTVERGDARVTPSGKFVGVVELLVDLCLVSAQFSSGSRCMPEASVGLGTSIVAPRCFLWVCGGGCGKVAR